MEEKSAALRKPLATREESPSHYYYALPPLGHGSSHADASISFPFLTDRIWRRHLGRIDDGALVGAHRASQFGGLSLELLHGQEAVTTPVPREAAASHGPGLSGSRSESRRTLQSFCGAGRSVPGSDRTKDRPPDAPPELPVRRLARAPLPTWRMKIRSTARTRASTRPHSPSACYASATTGCGRV
jgi:hypothetical protein